MAFGMWAFFAALGAGPISVVSPLAAVLNAAVPVAPGEQAPHACKLSPLVFARMSATLVVLLMSGASKNLRLPRGKPLKLALGLGARVSIDGLSVCHARRGAGGRRGCVY